MAQVKLGVQQRIYPSYRRSFFELLAASNGKGFSLFAGDAEAWENVTAADELSTGTYQHAHNLHLGKERSYFCYQTNLMQWLRKWNPDCLVMEANPRYLASRQAIRWMHRQNRPVIGWGLGAPHSRNPLVMQAWRKFVGEFDAMIAYSQNGKEEYIALGVPRKSVFVAPNAVLPAPDEPYKVRSKHPQVNILFVGRLQARKKVDQLIKACAALKAQGEKVALVIVGDGPEKENLQQLAATWFPAAKFTGALHGEDVKPYFQHADLFVLPGTGGLAVQEAMSYGLPVIVAEADGTQSNMVRHENGWLIDPANDNGLLEALQQAVMMRENLPVMGKISYDIASKEVNIEKMVQVFWEAIAKAQQRRAECESS